MIIENENLLNILRKVSKIGFQNNALVDSAKPVFVKRYSFHDSKHLFWWSWLREQKHARSCWWKHCNVLRLVNRFTKILFWWCCLLVLAEILTLLWCFGFYCHYACSLPVKNCYKDILSIFVWSLHWLHVFCVLWAIIITFCIFLVYCLVNMKYTILFYSIQVYWREVTLGSHSLRKALGIAYELFILVKEEVLKKTGLAL